MDDNTYKQVFAATTELEALLEEKFGARGKGLHAKANAIEGHLGEGLMKKIRFIASVRNQLAHQTDAEVPLQNFLRASAQVKAALEALDPVEAPAYSEVSALSRQKSSAPHRRRTPLWAVPVVILVMLFGPRLFSHSSDGVQASSTPATQNGSSNDAPAEEKPEVPLWSVEHVKHAQQQFPWREEQAAFITGGEKGTLPNETLWFAIPPVREVKKKSGSVLELDLQLGGGTLKAKAIFKVGDDLGQRFTVSGITTGIDIGVKSRSADSVHGMALKKDGASFGSFDAPFKCQRELPESCANWLDQGVVLVAVSLVSFDNVLKVVYAR